MPMSLSCLQQLENSVLIELHCSMLSSSTTKNQLAVLVSDSSLPKMNLPRFRSSAVVDETLPCTNPNLASSIRSGITFSTVQRLKSLFLMMIDAFKSFRAFNLVRAVWMLPASNIISNEKSAIDFFTLKSVHSLFCLLRIWASSFDYYKNTESFG